MSEVDAPSDVIVSPHAKKLSDHQREVALGNVVGVELHRVTCPYCTVGAALVTVRELSGGAKQFDLKDPVRCESCNEYFALAPSVKIVGRPLSQS